jgi:thermitase
MPQIRIQNTPSHLKTAYRLLLTLLLLVGTAGTSLQVAASETEPQSAAEFVPGRVIVKLRANPLPGADLEAATVSAIDQLQARSEVASARPVFAGPFSDPALASEIGLERVFVLELQEGLDPFAIIETLAADPAFEYAEPDYILTTAVAPNDYYFNLQWGLNNTGQTILGSPGKPDADIDLPEAWNITKGSQEVVIAIVDTGVDLTHPDLASKLVAGYNTVDENTNAQDYNGHGTHVAGIAAASTDNSSVGVAGVCWNCKIMPIKALGTSSGSIEDVAQGITYAVDHGADVINLSLGGPEGSTTLLLAVRYAYSKNIPVVAAMMNYGTGDSYYPAAYPETIAVGATDNLDVRADYSNYGNHIDLVAPGSDILSTYYLNQYGYMSGTSMSSPHVAGVLGLLRSLSPSRTVEQLRTILRSSADDLGVLGWDVYYGAGRLNANKALQQLAAITSVSLRGPYTVKPGLPATFTARVSPSTAATPITYTWTATGQTNRSFTTTSLTNQVTYTWTTPGLKTVRVTASNLSSTRSTTFTIAVGRPLFLPALRTE